MTAKIESTPVSLPAAADLTTKLFRFGKATATGINVCSVAGEKADGIIGAHQKKTGVVVGDAVDFYIDRLPIVEAGAAFAINAELTTDANGKAKAAGAGDVVNAVALEASTADGQYIRVRTPYTRSPAAMNVANVNTAPGSLIVHTIDVPDAATGDIDTVITDKIEVLEVVVQKRGANGGAANTVQVKNGANAITDAISTNINDQTAARQATIDDAQSTIAAGGTLRVSRVKAGGNAACHVTVIGVKRA